jgi:leucyl/phenylalanyl-tRNA--protein transferase
MTYQETWPASTARLEMQREQLFRERPFEFARRIVLGIAWRMRPKRVSELPGVAALHLREWVNPKKELPDPRRTLAWAPEVAGIAHDLTVPTLVAAYSRGLHPLSHVLQPKWMSPHERAVLRYDDFQISKTHRAHIRKQKHRVTFDRAFDRVMKSCAEPRGNRLHLTWLTPKLMRAYADLHDAGYAHSFEVWNQAQELVGGGFGVSVGRCYTLKTMFCWESDSSKTGFAYMNWHLAKWGMAFTDMGTPAPYKQALGCKLLPRSDYLAALSDAVRRQPAAAIGKSRRTLWQLPRGAPTASAFRGRASCNSFCGPSPRNRCRSLDTSIRPLTERTIEALG